MSETKQRALLEIEGSPRPAREIGPADARSELRLKRAERRQRRLISESLDDELAKDDMARVMWEVTGKLDLSPLYAGIQSRGSNAGAPAIDPRIPLCLWVYATSEGEGSAREIARLCQEHVAYRWICGGVSVKAHHLSDFRSANGALFCDLITQVVVVLLKNGLCELTRVAQDGTRVRASAGAASFRRQETLEKLREEARRHLEEVLKEGEDSGISAIRRAARERGARDRLSRIEDALTQISEVQATRQRRGDDTAARVSTTDPDARVMKCSDGGFRPTYNVQFATTTDEARVIVGVETTPFGTDQGAAEPMMEQLDDRYGQRPSELLVDGGYRAHDTLDELAADGTTVYAPLPKQRPGHRPPEAPRETDSPAVAEWRARMQTPEAKEIYKERCATAETVNADAKAHRGLDHIPIRGVDKAFACAALFALTYDILRLICFTRGL